MQQGQGERDVEDGREIEGRYLSEHVWRGLHVVKLAGAALHSSKLRTRLKGEDHNRDNHGIHPRVEGEEVVSRGCLCLEVLRRSKLSPRLVYCCVSG